MLSTSTPRSIVGGAPVAAGTSGGVTALGTLAGCGGALAIASGGASAGLGGDVAIAAFVGGTTGMLVDSLLGATVQERRWCDRCAVSTEQSVHTCGATTRHARGVSWLNNDGVNAIATAAGAVVATGVQLAVLG
jgi:uncharacterized membrane protein